MVDVRVMWVSVLQGEVCMTVAVLAAATRFRVMRMLVVLIMLVFVLMFQHFMQVLMGMVLSQV